MTQMRMYKLAATAVVTIAVIAGVYVLRGTAQGTPSLSCSTMSQPHSAARRASSACARSSSKAADARAISTR